MSTGEWLKERLSDQMLFDHYCTPPHRFRSKLPLEFLRQGLLPDASPATLSEAPFTLGYRLAIRQLANLLTCDPTEQAILEARAQRHPASYIRLLADDARLGPCCVQVSEDEAVLTPNEWSEMIQRPVAQAQPIEPLAERILPHCSTWDEFRTLFAQALAESLGRGAIALSSDFPQRTSLAIHPVDLTTAERAFSEVRAAHDTGMPPTLQHRTLLYAIFWVALEVAAELNTPLQVVLDSTGTRDPHADDPALFRSVLEEPRYQHVPIILITHTGFHPHIVPLVRHYSHLFCDPGPSFLRQPVKAARLLRDLVTSIPTSKLLASTGGALIPERQWFVAKLWHDSLHLILGFLIDRGYLTLAEAESDARTILAGNAQRVYRFPR